MINPFVIKKWAALLSCGLFTTIFFFIGVRYYGFWAGIGLMFVGLLFSLFIGNMLLAQPFRDMVEGKGIMALNLDSTGIIRPFLIVVDNFYMWGKLNGRKIKDVFDRAIVYQLATPRKAQGFFISDEMIQDVYDFLDYKEFRALQKVGDDKKKQDKVINEYAQLRKDLKGKLPYYSGAINLTLNEKEYNAGRFGLFHYPLIFYNEQINSVLTKDFLAQEEKEAFAEHQVLYLNRKMEELTSIVRDFSRYVIELLKPKEQGGTNWVVWVIIGLAILAIGIFLFPQILKLIQGSGGQVMNAASNALNTGKNTITQVTP